MYKVLAWVALLSCGCGGKDHGFQYSSFSGPVSGAIREITVPYVPHYAHGPSHQQSHYAVDYVAKPDYSFTYGVEDPETGNSQKHTESRDGDSVKGQYSVVEPDGTLRTVSYTADATNGFKATVHYSGTPVAPPTKYSGSSSPPPTYYSGTPAPKYKEYDEYE